MLEGEEFYSWMTFRETGNANKTDQGEGVPYLKYKECWSIKGVRWKTTRCMHCWFSLFSLNYSFNLYFMTYIWPVQTCFKYLMVLIFLTITFQTEICLWLGCDGYYLALEYLKKNFLSKTMDRTLVMYCSSQLR